MKTLDQLINLNEPAFDRVRASVSKSASKVELLPPAENREEVLLKLQVTTRSTLGALVYETGGMLIDNGWIRFLGSGSAILERDIIGWNKNKISNSLLVADDAIGGFFAINDGGLGPDMGNMYYWAPDSLDWEELEIGFTDFFEWALSDRVNGFYEDLGKKWLQQEYRKIGTGECLNFYPFLWTEEGSVKGSTKKLIPIEEAFFFKTELSSKLAR